MTDARVEAFLVDILALEGENPDAIRDGAHRACHVLCRARVVEEIQRRKRTRTAEHLKYVLSLSGKVPGRAVANFYHLGKHNRVPLCASC